MNINIKFNNNNYIIKTKRYQSIYSLINQFIEENEIEYNINDLFLDYNGSYLDNNLSLEKYNIYNNYELNLNIKLKGGKKKKKDNSFFTFFKKNPYIVLLSFSIALLPLIILPTGFMPSLASLIENIIKKSFDSIAKYLVCYLGKKTLYSRLQWSIIFIKYTIFFIMIYVVITLPLTLLCVTIKGHSIVENPSAMCSPIKCANFTGLLLTIFFILTYGFYRIGDIVLYFFIDIFKKFYITDTLINPILTSLLKMYDLYKYFPIYFIPFIGVGFKSYFSFLDIGLNGFQSVLSTISELGCKAEFSKKAFMDLLGKTLEQNLKENNNKIKKNSIEVPSDIEPMCISQSIKCCSPSNFINIGNTIKQFIENPIVSSGLKASRVYSIFILILEGIYEYALSNIGITGKIPNNPDERVDFLKGILQDKSNKLTSGTTKIIKEYLTTFDPNLIHEIENNVDTDLANNIQLADNVNNNLLELQSLMISYSYETGSKYIPGPSLFKIVMKYVFLNSICNVFQTSKSSLDIIESMKDINNISDMLKSGCASGIIIALYYFIALIVLIIMGIFDKY
jgi:hypothetical protein